MTPYQIISSYPEQQFNFVMNRLFYDHGEASILDAIKLALSKDDSTLVSSLEFISSSLLQYQKQSWKKLLNNDLKTVLTDLSVTGNYFARVKSVEILHQLASHDEEALEAYYVWLQKQFYLHYTEGMDPLMLFNIFYKLNTRYGGTWVFDYEIDMIQQLLEHPSPAMQIIGLACFKSMNPDQEEVPESLWQWIATMEQQFPFDVFKFMLAFEHKLKKEDQYTYTLEALETFIAAQDLRAD